ncbi:GyrI-like small molecule binding protein [Ulvibacter sp. MAR_2010_11]|uniref:SRPBCC family protein n=1 Tax=Ulvibacter sp. MAR_2010_11 TaxID=1250229 RepID=UPI000C2C9DDB|nr:GyrI-like domain-containing protein [Ulvibacter sp. MAR_2010_11]PKA82200.1 GyrI-like small molecule binding protein [Ulvibacter sp. MAR_2010_11]
MKILKYLLFLILIAIIGGAIYFGTKDGSFDASESKVMDAPAPVIFNNIKDYKNWQEWGPWMKIDSAIVINYAEKTEGEGASYSWSSDHMEVGNGSMKTIRVIPNKEIDQKITFNTPIGDSESDVYWRFEETETPGQTKVTWGMKGEQSFMEKVFMAFQEDDMETGIKQMFQQGLNDIDAVVKAEMESFTINVDGVTQYGGGYYMYNTTASKMNEIGEKMGSMMGQVAGYMDENKLNMAGMPFTIYNQIDEANGTVIFTAAIPVKERVITPSGSPVLCGFMEPTTTLKTTLKGKYDHLSKAYEKAKMYLAENNLQADLNANMFEVYSTDPGEVPNPADWVTEIYIPIIPPVNPEN